VTPVSPVNTIDGVCATVTFVDAETCKYSWTVPVPVKDGYVPGEGVCKPLPRATDIVTGAEAGPKVTVVLNGGAGTLRAAHAVVLQLLVAPVLAEPPAKKAGFAVGLGDGEALGLADGDGDGLAEAGT
jgi:hypothetical protein